MIRFLIAVILVAICYAGFYRFQTYRVSKIKYNLYEIECLFCSEQRIKTTCPSYGYKVKGKGLTSIMVSCRDAWGWPNH